MYETNRMRHNKRVYETKIQRSKESQRLREWVWIKQRNGEKRKMSQCMMQSKRERKREGERERAKVYKANK